MIGSIESLRGLYVLMIFLVHYTIDGKSILVSGGDCGVAFFLMTSGFVMSAGYYRQTEHINPFGFAILRSRIFYPMHLICMAVAVILYHIGISQNSILFGLANLQLIQSWVPDAICYFGYNPVAWFLSDIAFCYVIFAVLAMYNLLEKRKFIIGFLLLVACYVVAIQFINADRQEINYICYILPLSRTFDFISGMLLWLLYRRMINSTEIKQKIIDTPIIIKTIIELAVIAITVLSMISYPTIKQCYQAAAMWWPSTTAVLLVFSLFDGKCGGWVSKLLGIKLLRQFGQISFVFFIVHVLVIDFVRIFTYHFDIMIDQTLKFIITLILTIAVSIILHYYIQLPWKRFIKK